MDFDSRIRIDGAFSSAHKHNVFPSRRCWITLCTMGYPCRAHRWIVIYPERQKERLNMSNSLDEIKKSWEKETDNYLVKAVTIYLHEYPPEVQEIIKNEVIKRGLEKAKFVAYPSAEVEKEFAKTSYFVQRYVHFFDGYVAKYSYFSKMFIPLMMFLYTLCGALGVLIAEALKKLFYKEIEPEEQIIYRKKGKNRIPCL